MESKSQKNIKAKPEGTPRYTIEQLEAMRDFANSQIKILNEAGSKDKTLLDYLDGKRKKAEEEIKKLRGEK